MKKVKLMKELEDEYLIWKEGELFREVDAYEEQLNEEAEVCPGGFEFSEAPGCADSDCCPMGDHPCPWGGWNHDREQGKAKI